MRKRARTSVVDVWERELGLLSTRNFTLRLAASQDLFLRLDLYKKLAKHRGCVNTVNFSRDGNILVSGSDDMQIVLWDWETGNSKLTFHSGHRNNIFHVKILPLTNDQTMITVSADGEVRHAQILDSGVVETKSLGKHNGRAHKLAIVPGTPHIFYTCGEDGMVQHFDLRTGSATPLFSCKPIDYNRPQLAIPLNTITIDPRNPDLFAVAGGDEFTRLYDIRKYKWGGSGDFGQPTDYFCPSHLVGNILVAISGLSFSDQSELLVSYIDENIYLFSREMGMDPKSSKFIPQDGPRVFKGHGNRETVKSVSFLGPRCEYVSSGSDHGHIFIWKKKSGELIRIINKADKHVVNCVEPHPHTTVLTSCGIESDIKIWTPKASQRATLLTNVGQV